MVTIRGVTQANTGATATNSLSITLPLCQTGDVLYLYIANNFASATFTAPTGWTLVDSRNVRVDNYGFLYRKTAVSGDSGSNVTISFAAGCAAAATAVSLLATHDAEVSGSSATDATTITIPAVTPVATDCLRLAFVSNCYRLGTDTAGMTAPSGWAENSDTWTSSSGNSIEVGLYTIQLAGQAGVAQSTAVVSVPGNSHSSLVFSATAAPKDPTPSTTITSWSSTAFVPTMAWSGTAWVPVKSWDGTTWRP